MKLPVVVVDKSLPKMSDNSTVATDLCVDAKPMTIESLHCTGSNDVASHLHVFASDFPIVFRL
jgi:hypothetical protein